MADKEPNKYNNYYLVGGQLNANDKNNSIEMPPKKSRDCKEATIVLNSGNYIIAKAEDHVAIKDDKGVITTRKDGKDGRGKTLTGKNTKSKSTRPSERKSEDNSFDMI